MIRGVSCAMRVSSTGTNSYTPHVITCPCPWYLLLAQHFSYKLTYIYLFICRFILLCSKKVTLPNWWRMYKSFYFSHKPAWGGVLQGKIIRPIWVSSSCFRLFLGSRTCNLYLYIWQICVYIRRSFKLRLLRSALFLYLIYCNWFQLGCVLNMRYRYAKNNHIT